MTNFAAMLKSNLIILSILGLLCCASCSDFKRITMSTDNEMKYEVAMDYFERKDYSKALQLFDLLQASFRGTPKGENISYNTALCYYQNNDFEVAEYYFKRFVQGYPFSNRAETASFLAAFCSYKQSPISSLDQTKTNEAITQLKQFVEHYPESDSLQSANRMIKELNEKLEEKDYNICMLFYRMENYTAAITSFENLLKKFPDTEHREEILFDMAKTYYDYAENSVSEKQRERYEACIERHNTLMYLYPESKYLKELEGIAANARKKLENLQ